MTMSAMLDLGAPPLPAGHFYRVGSIPMQDGTYVSIMRERRFFPKRVMSARVVGYDYETGAYIDITRALATAASEAKRDFNRARRLADLTGDHK